MARSLLVYSVVKEEVYCAKKDTIVQKIKHRGFDFSVSGVKSEEEEDAYLNSFVGYLLKETGIDARGNFFGDGGRNYVDQETGEAKSNSFVYIPVCDMEQKEDVRRSYRIWKRDIKPTLEV